MQICLVAKMNICRARVGRSQGEGSGEEGGEERKNGRNRGRDGEEV